MVPEFLDWPFAFRMVVLENKAYLLVKRNGLGGGGGLFFGT